MWSHKSWGSKSLRGWWSLTWTRLRLMRITVVVVMDLMMMMIMMVIMMVNISRHIAHNCFHWQIIWELGPGVLSQLWIFLSFAKSLNLFLWSHVFFFSCIIAQELQTVKIPKCNVILKHIHVTCRDHHMQTCDPCLVPTHRLRNTVLKLTLTKCLCALPYNQLLYKKSRSWTSQLQLCATANP